MKKITPLEIIQLALTQQDDHVTFLRKAALQSEWAAKRLNIEIDKLQQLENIKLDLLSNQ